MNRDEQDRLLNHEYDGIREYDNPTPGWWNWLFAATVLFSVVYWAWYHLGTEGSTVQQDWEARQVSEFKRIFGKLGELKADEPTIVKMMGDQQMLAVARGIFQANCAACHGRDGGGITGPNMTDDRYKNIRTIEDFYTVITKGAASGAMPAWESRLSANERIILAAFTASLRGTTPATPKPPEGDNAPPPWPKPEAAPAGDAASAGPSANAGSASDGNGKASGAS
jgi:cytochrome c oxidase cbb3-type subunit 3